MATYSDIIKFEEEAGEGVIRLIKSGGFYRAYNHSAWLFQCCITEHKVIRRYVKSLERNIYYIGFPDKNLFANIGERESEKTELGFDVHLNPDELPDEEGYKTWLAAVETEQSSKGDFLSLPIAGADAEREVIRQLREFPLESKSMLECAVFLAGLRKLLSNK